MTSPNQGEQKTPRSEKMFNSLQAFKPAAHKPLLRNFVRQLEAEISHLTRELAEAKADAILALMGETGL